MLQLTFHDQLPDPELVAFAHQAHAKLRNGADARFDDACLSITLLDRGETARTRHRAVFAWVRGDKSLISVITEAADPSATLRSGFAIVQGASRTRAFRTHDAEVTMKPAFCAPRFSSSFPAAI